MILSQSHKYWIAGIRIPRCQTVDRIHGFQDSWSIWNMLKQMVLWNVWVVQWNSYVSLCICVYISFMWSSKCLSIKQNLGTACLLELPASNTAAKKTLFAGRPTTWRGAWRLRPAEMLAIALASAPGICVHQNSWMLNCETCDYQYNVITVVKM